MRTIRFVKMHGLGNDFVVIDAVSQDVELSHELICKIAKRNFGVGCDQILVVEPPPNEQRDVDFTCRVFNADGNEAGQCGNGARCMAKFIMDEKLSNKKDLVFSVRSRKFRTHLESDGQVTVDLGKPVFNPAEIPFVAKEEALRYNLRFANNNFEAGVVSVGNPHVVILVDDIMNDPAISLGAQISKSEYFPEGVNVNFMQVLDRESINLRVYERGSGETLACGSGACASVVIGKIWGLLDQAVEVHLFGGELLIRVDEANNIFMTGPAERVFVGEMVVQ